MKTRDKGVKRHEAFNNKIETIAKKFEGQPSDFYQWEVATRAGKLFISVHEPRKSSLFSIYCSFDEPKRAKEIIPNDHSLNLHSGKWNFHSSDDKGLIKLFEAELNYLVNGAIPIN